MSIGVLMAFYSLVGISMSPVATLINTNRATHDALIATDRLFQILDLETEDADCEKIATNEVVSGDIRLKDVTFQYGSRSPLFKHLNLIIKKGKMTAIVGESGSGKSTIAKLLQKQLLL